MRTLCLPALLLWFSAYSPAAAQQHTDSTESDAKPLLQEDKSIGTEGFKDVFNQDVRFRPLIANPRASAAYAHSIENRPYLDVQAEDSGRNRFRILRRDESYSDSTYLIKYVGGGEYDGYYLSSGSSLDPVRLREKPLAYWSEWGLQYCGRAGTMVLNKNWLITGEFGRRALAVGTLRGNGDFLSITTMKSPRDGVEMQPPTWKIEVVEE